MCFVFFKVGKLDQSHTSNKCDKVGFGFQALLTPVPVLLTSTLDSFPTCLKRPKRSRSVIFRGFKGDAEAS